MELSFNEHEFRRRLENAIKTVKKLLDNDRAQLITGADTSVKHTYEDKYLLVEHLTNILLATHFEVLAKMGLQPYDLRTLVAW